MAKSLPSSRSKEDKDGDKKKNESNKKGMTSKDDGSAGSSRNKNGTNSKKSTQEVENTRSSRNKNGTNSKKSTQEGENTRSSRNKNGTNSKKSTQEGENTGSFLNTNGTRTKKNSLKDDNTGSSLNKDVTDTTKEVEDFFEEEDEDDPRDSKFHDITREIANNPGKLKLLGVKIADHQYKLGSEPYDPMNPYFGIPIREEDEPTLLKKDSQISTEVITEAGRVIRIEVDPEVVFEYRKQRAIVAAAIKTKCCMENSYEMSPELQDDPKARGTFLFRVLLWEAYIKIPSLFWLYAQYRFSSFHDFIYTQWFLNLLLVLVIYITVVWASSYTELGRHHPCDNILVLTKAFITAMVGGTLTSFLERVIVRWVLREEEFDDIDSIVNLRNARKPPFGYTYPFGIFYYFADSIIICLIVAVFFRFLKGDVKKDTMLYIVVVIELAMMCMKFPLVVNGPSEFEKGPPEWNSVHVLGAGLAVASWELWRLFSLRELMDGKKMVVITTEYKIVALVYAH